MLSPDAASDRAQALIARARRAGADAADAVYSADASESVSVRLGSLEDVERSESEHISLRAFVGSRSASIGSSDMSDEALEELAARAVAMARLAPEDAYAGLAPEDMLARGQLPALDLDDPAEPSPADLRATAEQAEDAARAVAGVTNSEGGSASAGRSLFALVTSHGFRRSLCDHQPRAVGQRGCRRGLGHAARLCLALGAPRRRTCRARRKSAHLAGTRAVARLNPGRVKSGPMPIVFDPRVGGTLVGHLVGAIAGSAIARRASFLLDRLDEDLFDSALVIADAPHRPRGLRSRPFDGEGLPTAPRNLVEHGKVTGWLMDSASARQLGFDPHRPRQPRPRRRAGGGHQQRPPRGG